MNEKLKQLISIPKDNASPEDDELLIEELKNAQLIMPIEITSTINLDDVNMGDVCELEDSLGFKPIKIADSNKNQFVALFTDEDELVKSNVEVDVLNIFSGDLADMISDAGDEYFGIAINPFSEYSLAIPLNDFLNLFKKE